MPRNFFLIPVSLRWHESYKNVLVSQIKTLDLLINTTLVHFYEKIFLEEQNSTLLKICKYSHLSYLHCSKHLIEQREAKNCRNFKLQGTWVNWWSENCFIRQSLTKCVETNWRNQVKKDFYRKCNSWFCPIFLRYCQVFVFGTEIGH